MSIEQDAMRGACGDAEKRRNDPNWRKERLSDLKHMVRWYNDRRMPAPDDVIAEIRELGA